MKKEEILLRKYLEGLCTPVEKELVESWIDNRISLKRWDWKSESQKELIKIRVQQRLNRQANQINIKQRLFIKPFIIAASILCIISISLYTHLKSRDNQIKENEVFVKSVKPGTKSAVLTLEDGSRIELGDAANGVLSQQGAITIKKVEEGKLSYEVRENQLERKVSKNHIAIPRGGQYQLILPDGTNVWLNSESSLSYPSNFSGKERRVTLKGEAYFEVAKNKKQPFIVEAGTNEILVLGTHFNVSAYEDDRRVLTTLLEGEVDVSNGGIQKLKLNPGQQAISTAGASFTLKKVDAESAIAWKNGYFLFDDQEIRTIMGDIARWYDVDVLIKTNGKKSKRVNGMYSRSKSLDELLKFLEKLKVAEFEKEERRITVML